MADLRHGAAASLAPGGGSGLLPPRGPWPAAGSSASQILRRLPALAFALLLACPAQAASNKVRITDLGDVAFGSIANLSADASRSQNVCLYADTSSGGYTITATGTGAGGAFLLSSGAGTLPYEVQWSSASGQVSGTALSAGVTLTGQTSTATHQSCSNGPAASASLIVRLRSTALSSAPAGSYSGTLTLLVGPE